MSARKTKGVLVLSVLLLGLIVVMSVTRFSQATKAILPPPDEAAARPERAPLEASTENTLPVQAPVMKVERKPLIDTIAGLVGTIKGNTIEMSFNGQEERLMASHVDVGQRVKAGQVLFELDHTRARARRIQAESALVRAKELLMAGGATVYDLKDAQAAYDLANKDYQDTFIYAPVSGSLSQINKHVGETMGRADIMAVLIASEGRLVVETGIVESQLGAVAEGQKATIEIDAFPGKKIEGKVVGVSREVTTTGRTGLVLIGIPLEIQKNLRPGLSARAEIITYDVPSLSIPRQAYDADKKSVMVVGADGKAVARPVQIGYVTRDFYQVIDGLSEGDAVILDVVTHPVAEGTRIAASPEKGNLSPAS